MRAIASYRRTSIESAPNEELIVLLCDEGVRRAEKARAAMERGDRAAWLADIHVARAIYLELLHALDPSVAPTIAGSLMDTYRWLVHHLTEAGRTGDQARMLEVSRVATVVQETWSRAVSIHRGDVIGLGGAMEDGTPVSPAWAS